MADPARDLLRYWNGMATVYGDPLRLHRRFVHALAGETDQVLEDAESVQDGVAYPAVERLLEAIRFAFELPPLDPATGQGATEQHCRDALDALTDFFAPPPANSAGEPTSVPPTAPASLPSATASNSDSGPTLAA